MGSLLPGWDERSPGIAPKEFQDYNENEDEDVGYFAAYAKLKKLQKEAAGKDTSPMAIGQQRSLTRRLSLAGSSSDQQQRASPRALLSRASMPASGFARDWTPMSPRQGAAGTAAATGRAGTPMAADGSASPAGFRSPYSAAGSSDMGQSGLHRMYSMPMTRGEGSDILAGLVPPSPSSRSCTSRAPSLDAYRTTHADKDKADYQWWRHLDSSALNERPDEPESKDDKGFTPQYAVTGQGIHFHGSDAEGLSIIHAH